MGRRPLILLLTLHCCCAGCGFHKAHGPSITAVPASPQNSCEPAGIPFYLPKPLLVVSKNFYHIEERTIGLTDSAPIPDNFDAQAQYGDINARSFHAISEQPSTGAGTPAPAVPSGGTASKSAPIQHSAGAPLSPPASGLPSDGLAPYIFFTYEIVFVPDLTQKYALQVTGGPGEMRAAMNLVNGWQFTGLGPYYLKDSSTAQNILSRGIAINLGLGGASDVVNSVANLADVAGRAGGQVQMSDVRALMNALQDASQTETFDWNQFSDKWTQRKIRLRDGSEAIVRAPPKIERYAEIFVYEAHLEGGQMAWQPLLNHAFDREFMGSVSTNVAPGFNQSSRALLGQALAAAQASSSVSRVPPTSEESKREVIRSIFNGPAAVQRGWWKNRRTIVNRQID